MSSLSTRVAIGSGTNGLITNADVETNAAIAGSKISPNFVAEDVVTTGKCQSTSCNVSQNAASLAADRYSRSFSETAATTDDTVTTLGTFAIPTGSCVSVVADVVACIADASVGASYSARATFRNAGGVVSQVGTTSSLDTDADGGAAAWVCTIDSSGTNARVRITGGVGETIRWTGRIVATVSKV
jgi:hypothetical protein